MTNIVWLEQALNHLQQIYDFYAETNEKKAFQIISRISDTVSILKIFPESAPVIWVNHRVGVEYRGLVAYKGLYKIIYYYQENGIYIFAIWDCRQNPDTLIQKVR